MSEASHLIAESHLRDFAPSWVLCDCGELLEADRAESVRLAFESHRRAMGEASVSLSVILGSRRRLPARLTRGQ